MSNAHTIKFGCGCDLCQQPKLYVEFPGIEECQRRQEAYRARRAIHAEAVGRPMKQMKIRGSDD